MKKEVALNVIGGMPKNFDLDELLEQLVVINKIDEGLASEKKDKLYSTEEVKRHLKKWRK